MTNIATVEINTTQKLDRFMVDPRNIIVVDGFNVRVDFGNLEELAQSIAKNGIINPLRVTRSKENNEQFELIDGERRLRATLLAISKGNDIARIPVILTPKGYKEEDRILDLIRCNDGKHLTAFEEGTVCKRLKVCGYKEKEIAEKIGRSLTYIYSVLKLANASKKIQNYIADSKITESTVLEIIRIEKDEAKQLELIESAIAKTATVTATTGKSKKVTKKDIAGINAMSTMKTLKTVLATLKENKVNNVRVTALEGLVEHLSNKENVETIVELFL